MTLYPAAMSGVPFTLQDQATTGDGRVLAIPNSFRNHTFTITGAADVTDGAIQLEASDDPAYAGTWAPIGGGPIDVPNDGIEQVTVSDVAYQFVRARISTTVSGGADPSVTVTYIGQK